MISVVIATRESERLLVPTLAALVPGAMTGLVSEVVVVDAASADDTEKVADIAGCRFIRSDAPLSARLRQTAVSTRTPWLMFLRPGSVPEPGWMAAAERFLEQASALEGAAKAAVFRPAGANDLMRPAMSEVLTLLRVMIGGGARPEQGLLIARRFYDALGGHPDSDAPEAAILKKLGRRRIAMLSAGARIAR